MTWTFLYSKDRVLLGSKSRDHHRIEQYKVSGEKSNRALFEILIVHHLKGIALYLVGRSRYMHNPYKVRYSETPTSEHRKFGDIWGYICIMKPGVLEDTICKQWERGMLPHLLRSFFYRHYRARALTAIPTNKLIIDLIS